MNIDAKLGLDVFKLDKEPHIVIDDDVCRTALHEPRLPLRLPRRPLRGERREAR